MTRSSPATSVTATMQRAAQFSPCGRYRYLLWRCWAAEPRCCAMFIGLNPSTADERADDPTTRRCIGFARAWGCDSLLLANLFAWRATDPGELLAAREPVGRDNDRHLRRAARDAAIVIAAWGANGSHRGRDALVRRLDGIDERLHCLRLTKRGFPAHPLYLPSALQPVRWRDQASH